MVDARAKGARGEYSVRDMMREHTGMQWERTPASGALEYQKGDLYIPNCNNRFCVEAKGYADDHLTSAILTSKSPQLLQFWEQAVRQGNQVKKEPLLIFKHDRSKLFVAFTANYLPSKYPHIYVFRDKYEFYVSLLEDWLVNEQPEFTS